MSDVTATILRFLDEIGIEARPAAIDDPTIVPGVHIERGVIVFDPGDLRYPGDLLHEAGHIAFTPEADRPLITGPLDTGAGDEMAAIAWSYAAAVYLGLDPAIVFHDGGYRGSSPAIVENFRAGNYVGVPLLEWAGMTVGPKPGAHTPNAFPLMSKWLRD